eukprot:jgi/Undpi1/1768/HiC_scaffold_12.g05155.m1
MSKVGSNDNNDGVGGGGGRGREQEMALTPQPQKKQHQGSSDTDHSKVIFDISRDAVEKLMLYHQHSFAEAMAGLDEALNMHVEFFAKHLVFPMQSPILFRKQDMRRQIRAALADAAKAVPREIERFTKAWSIRDKPGMSVDDARELANTHSVESKLGGVVVRYVVHDNKDSVAQQAVGNTTEIPLSTSTILQQDKSDDTIVATPPIPGSQTDTPAANPAPPSSSGLVEKTGIAEELVADALLGRNDPNCSGLSKPPPLCLSDQEGSEPPPTPPLSPPPASASMDQLPLPAEPTPLVLLPPLIVDQVVVGGSMSSKNDGDDSCGGDSSASYKPLPLSSSSEEGSPTPSTPPPSSTSASSMDEPPQSPDIEPPLLALPSSTQPTAQPLVRPPPPPSASTFSANPLGGMFSPPLDQPRVIAVITDILCSKRVMNDRKKAVRVLAKMESGCICGEDMEWIVRGMKTLKAKRELKQRHGGLVFAGPQYGAPLYKTGNGIRRLLRGVAKKHAGGTKFVVCVSSSSGKASNNAKMITGIISPSTSDEPAPASDTAGGEPVMDGDVPGLVDWSKIRGNLDDGCRLWAWVY